MRIKAKNPRGSHGYYVEPLTAQHVVDGVAQLAADIGAFIRFVPRYLISKKFRLEVARQYNRAMFAHIPTSQIYVTDSVTGEMRPLRPDERTWPE